MAPSHNNPAIRRIRADVNELTRDKSTQYKAVPCEDNIFEWHFAIRGPRGTDFEGGIYHGRIVLPTDYPFKPPSIIFLTPNGRWKTKEKICLSISNYHPEQWQPAWGIRTILEAIISFMTTPAEGAIGAIEVSPEERRRLAIESRKYSHALMPILPDEDDENSPESSKQETESRDPMNNISNEESQSSENTTERISDINVNDGDNLNTARRTSRPPSDRVDSILGNISMALLITIFALLYRKALNLYA